MLRSSPAVDDVAVIGVPDDRWGESVCAVVQSGGARPSLDELVTLCRDRLAGYKKPRRVEFVDQLPRTASGKVQKHRLRARFGAVTPPPTAASARSER